MAVKRVGTHTETYELGHLKLYRDDLEQIAKAVSEAGTLKIECGGWEMTEPSDFTHNTSLPDKLPKVTMMAGPTNDQPRVKVTLSRDFSTVELTEPDMLTEGVLNRIQRITEARRRMRRVKVAPVVLLAAVGFAALLALEDIRSPLHRHLFWVRIGEIVVGLPILVLMLERIYQSTVAAVLINARRAERPSFWYRTRDDWVVGTVMLLVGAVLGGVIGYWINTIT